MDAHVSIAAPGQKKKRRIAGGDGFQRQKWPAKSGARAARFRARFECVSDDCIGHARYVAVYLLLGCPGMGGEGVDFRSGSRHGQMGYGLDDFITKGGLA